ncbi:SH3 domain-containing protein [Argonema antarcticum]|uniref:SH3 domain-containing protein n=1 Tax=Argonema antarcticum TaxID=2942763 RepID=UPI002013807B|nr:SH3 domain-containing protein [Argonema antarcticum]MCL1471330.1 SH3 domain-containing protein [Argonema antarcticum A004/B2]
MKVLKALKSMAVMALLSVGMTGFSFPSAANASSVVARSVRYEREVTTYYNRGGYEIASAGTTCRRVSTNGGRLNVRRVPGGRIVGKLYGGTRVWITGYRSNGWVRITGPVRGYVSGSYLRSCR